jgi:serine-type D-Ala-D-Ala carboxypeptidase (penicillin-binding protein 5/6)
MGIAIRLTGLAAAGGIVVAGLAACSSPAHAPQAMSAGHPPQAAAAQSTPGGPTASPTPAPSPSIQVASAPQHVTAAGGALANAATMQLLWSRDPDTERPIGSIVKVMTALVVIESGDLNRKLRIPRAVIAYVAKYQGESAGLRPGDLLTTQQLLEAMLLQSGCDAAYVLATNYGPGMSGFLAKMNATAYQLGMLHTHFTSPDGLPYPTEYSTYSTPSDLLKLGEAAMRLPAFRAIVDQRFYQVKKGPGHHAYWWDNTNELIGTYGGADGIKTGYTDAAKHCLLFEAVRHNLTLLGVVLGSPATGPYTADAAAAHLLNWGFGLKVVA